MPGAVVEGHAWGRENWFPYREAEHKAVREKVALMNMSFMPEFTVQGRDAGEVLNTISANEVNATVNQITYTQWLNPHGTLEADLNNYWILPLEILSSATPTD